MLKKNPTKLFHFACNSIEQTKGGEADVNEKELIRQCQAGEKAAFDELIRMYYPYVSKYLLKLTGDETLTEDFVQETFLKMIRTIDQFDRNGKASFATYLIAIAKNTWIDHVRRNRAVFSELSEADGQPDESLEQQALSGLILVLPVVLIFFGVSVMMIFLPVLFVAAVILTVLSVFISKGAVYDEQISCMD